MGPSSLLFLFLCLRLMSCVIARTHEVQRNVGLLAYDPAIVTRSQFV